MKTATIMAFVLAFATAPALARPTPHQASPVTQFCGDRYCPSATASPMAVETRPAKHRGARRAAPTDANANKAFAPGVVVSHKTGATARVAAEHREKFQAYVDELESGGARIIKMGGLPDRRSQRPRCSPARQHNCGTALDVCQLRRGVVDPRCNLPGRERIAEIAARHDLFEGGRWCNSDYGHAQVGRSAGDCSSRMAGRTRLMR